MRNWCLFVLSLFACASVCANGGPERTARLYSKAVFRDGNGYCVLSDGSYWEVVRFFPRERTLCEWWNNVELVPKNYDCGLGDWVVGEVIQTYSKHALKVNDADAGNKWSLKQCTDLLVNTRTGKVLFGVSMNPNPVLFLSQISQRFYKEGWDDGWDDGYNEKQRQKEEEEMRARNEAAWWLENEGNE